MNILEQILIYACELLALAVFVLPLLITEVVYDDR